MESNALHRWKAHTAQGLSSFFHGAEHVVLHAAEHVGNGATGVMVRAASLGAWQRSLALAGGPSKHTSLAPPSVQQAWTMSGGQLRGPG